jgi:hypothetical protein
MLLKDEPPARAASTISTPFVATFFSPVTFFLITNIWRLRRMFEDEIMNPSLTKTG